MIQKFRTRSTSVLAIQYNGENLEEVETAVQKVCGLTSSLSYLLEPGSWVLLKDTSFQVLPRGVFHRVYELDDKQPTMLNVIPVPVAKTCFECIHHLGTRCELYNEEIESEIYAAADCSAWDNGGMDV